MMKLERVLVIVLSVSLFCAVPVHGAGTSGKWAAVITTPIGEMSYIYEFKVEGEKLTGKAVMSMGSESSESALTEGSVRGDEISFIQGQELRCEYRGKISGDEIRGSRTVGSYGAEEFVLRRAK
jgi:hypothetical protein